MKRDAEVWARRLIDGIDETDRWAMSSVAYALGAVAFGWYHLALAELGLAETPKDERSPLARQPPEHASLTKRDLEDALAYVEGMPARDH